MQLHKLLLMLMLANRLLYAAASDEQGSFVVDAIDESFAEQEIGWQDLFQSRVSSSQAEQRDSLVKHRAGWQRGSVMQTGERRQSIVISDPQLPSDSYRLPVSLAFGVVCARAILNRAHNTVTAIFPRDVNRGIAQVYTVFGTKSNKNGVLQACEEFLEARSSAYKVSKLTPVAVLRQNLRIIKGHDDNYIVYYLPSGVFTRSIDSAGIVGKKTKLLDASDRNRDMILVIDHAKQPGISFVFEKDLPPVDVASFQEAHLIKD